MTITGRRAYAVLILLIAESFVITAKGGDATGTSSKMLWQEPSDLEMRDLLYGQGGKKDQPPIGPFEFLKEDLNGTNPKFTVRDMDGVEWKVKLGAEARPETVATRLVWAVGYFTDEDYFVPEAELTNVPHSGLKRLNGKISSDSIIRNARFERKEKGEKKEGTWTWKQNDLSGSREMNGLRVLMAVINNWDLKDQNNTVVELKSHKDEPDQSWYYISDLGATFGTTNLVLGLNNSRGNLKRYEHSRFITHKTPDKVSFATPGRPTLLELVNPRQYFMRVRLERIGSNIPRADAKWMGTLLARLSPEQIRDAFRSAGYTPVEVDGFARVVERRIAELNAL